MKKLKQMCFCLTLGWWLNCPPCYYHGPFQIPVTKGRVSLKLWCSFLASVDLPSQYYYYYYCFIVIRGRKVLAGEETSEMPRIVDRPGLQTLLAVYIGICEAQKGKEVCPEADSCLDSASWLFGFSKSDTPHVPLELVCWCVTSIICP